MENNLNVVIFIEDGIGPRPLMAERISNTDCSPIINARSNGHNAVRKDLHSWIPGEVPASHLGSHHRRNLGRLLMPLDWRPGAAATLHP